MSAGSNRVFVDSGAWIALAITSDPYHTRAKSVWTELAANRSKLVTSIPVMMETFTFLDRNVGRGIATTWRDQVTSLRPLQLTECTLADLTKSWAWFDVRGLVRLSAVDATSFTIMRRLSIKRAFAFDQHYALAGFVLLG